MNTKILANRSDYLDAINEQRTLWVHFILESLDLDMDVILGDDKNNAFEYLVASSVDVVDYPEIGAVKVEFGGDIVGEWGQADFLLKKDESDGSLYYEISIENWSIFDD